MVRRAGTGKQAPGVSYVVAGCLMLACLVACVPPCSAAGNPGSPDPGLMLGSLLTFESEPEALAACGQGGVVWAERHAGYYFKPGERQYGRAPNASFACLSAAEAANYWGTDPMSGVLNFRGKSFPGVLRGYGS